MNKKLRNKHNNKISFKDIMLYVSSVFKQPLRFIQGLLIIRRDLIDRTLFYINKNERNKQNKEFKACHDLEDYWRFSMNIFQPAQIKVEILDFLKFTIPYNPRYICEIGMFKGGVTFLLSQAIPSASLIIGIDIYLRNTAQLRYFSRPSQSIIAIGSSSRKPRTTERVRRILSDRKLDLLFIDGDHRYESLKQDFLNYRHLVRENGIIAFHDIIPDYYSRFGIRTGNYAVDVPIFWDKIKSFYPSFEFVEDRKQDTYGIGAILYSENVSIPENL